MCGTRTTVQGHPRALISVALKRAYIYIVTFGLIAESTQLQD